MSTIAWLVKRDGLEKVEVAESTSRHQLLRVLEGEREGQGGRDRKAPAARQRSEGRPQVES